jgi:hypothetical protein
LRWDTHSHESAGKKSNGKERNGFHGHAIPTTGESDEFGITGDLDIQFIIPLGQEIVSLQLGG